MLQVFPFLFIILQICFEDSKIIIFDEVLAPFDSRDFSSCNSVGRCLKIASSAFEEALHGLLTLNSEETSHQTALSSREPLPPSSAIAPFPNDPCSFLLPAQTLVHEANSNGFSLLRAQVLL